MRLPRVTPALRRRPAPPGLDLTTEPDSARDPVLTELRLRYAHQHVAVTPDGLWAFFELAGVDWPLQTPQRRAATMTDQAHRWADLIGKRVWLRGLTNPFPHQAYAARLYRDSTGRLADVPGARSFEDLVDAAQLHTIRLDARRTVCVLGVLVSEYMVPAEYLPVLLTDEPLSSKLGQIDRVRRELRAVTAAVARPGFRGEPLTAAGLRWLLHASVGMGEPVPAGLLTGTGDGWVCDDVPGFTNAVYPTCSPYAPTVTLRTLRESRQHTGHVAVLHADRWEDRDPHQPDLLPWLYWAQTLPRPVEFCAVFDVLDGAGLRRSAELDRRRAKNVALHHDEHDDDPPARVLRGIDRAREVEDEVQNGSREVACRARGVVMFAVTGSTEEDTLQAAADLTADAARDQRMHLVHDYGQFDSYRAFIPGEACPMSGHVTQQPAYFLGTAVPNATSAAGDPTGFLVGNIAGGPDVFLFDTHAGASRGRSNLAVVGGDQGAGKSSLLGALADWDATRGLRTTVYDPSGPLAQLCKVPHLAGNARHLSLMGGARGVLVPHLMVVDPRRADYDTDAEYRSAVREAEAERMELAVDTLRDLLPYTMVSHDRTGELQRVIESAVRQVGGRYGEDPWKVVDRLRAMGETGRVIAESLTDRAAFKDGGLIFPDRDVDDEPILRMLNSAALTVITMEGLTLPPKGQPDRSLWTRQQLASVPILNLGARFAMRSVYADRKPKTVLIDELGILTSGASSFAAFVNRAGWDSRKYAAFVGLAFQNPDMLTALDRQISNLIRAVFIGRMDDTAARAALPLLRLRDDCGYDQVVTGLDQGEFLVMDWRERVRKVLVDRDWWHPDLLAALDTTPGGEGSYDEHDGDLRLSGVA